MINIKTYTITHNILVSNKLLDIYITNFWNDVFNNIKDTSHLLLMCKVQFNNSSYRTIGHLRKVNFSDKQLYFEYLSQNLSILNDSYVTTPISNITFSYVIKDGLCTDMNRKLLKDINNNKLAFHSFNKMNLPVSMNPSDYGIIRGTTSFDNFTRYFVIDNSKVFQIDVYLDGLVNKVTILGAINLNWTDTRLINDLEDSYTFKRVIKKSTIYFLDSEVVLSKQILNAKAFNKMKVDKKLVNDFYTMDIETIKQSNGKLIPYLICAYDRIKYITSYGSDPKVLFNTFLDELLSKIKPGLTIIYAHNLSTFDGIFLMRYLLKYGEVNPLLHNSKLMTIKVKIGNKTIVFKDSYLLLPLSLRKLCEAFGTELPKGYFPFNLTDIFYSGVFPKFQYWTKIDLNQFTYIKNLFGKRMWNFQNEATKYCQLDCKVLHEILTKFNELIFREFQVNIHDTPTLPSLAMKIYRIHFMPENTIYQILNKPYWNIRESYTGGAVDVYIPHNRISGLFGKVKALFKQLFYYDVNSLYPSVMANHLMPIGKPIAFEGDIRKMEPNAYGFFYCKITSPTSLKHPLLQRRIKTNDGIRTIAGLGSWSGWVSSVEMDNAIKYGYTFEIIKGYQFETGNIFKEYVQRMYNLRLKYSKGDAMNLIAKLLMNSLYGKFAMKLERTEVAIYNCSTDEGMKEFIELISTLGKSVKIDTS